VDLADEDDSSDDASANRTQVMRNAPGKQALGAPVAMMGAGDRARAVRRAPVALGGAPGASAPMASLGSGNAVRAEYASVETASDSGLRAAPPEAVKADHASIGSIMAMPGYEPPRRSGIGLASDHAVASGKIPVLNPGSSTSGAIVTPMSAPALVAPSPSPSQGRAVQPVDFAATIQKKSRYGSFVGVLAILFAAGMTVFIWHRLQLHAGADGLGNAAATAATGAAGANATTDEGAGASSASPSSVPGANAEPSSRTPAEVGSDRTTWGEPVRPRAPDSPRSVPTPRGRRDRRH
jgi:hypothetical protein